MQKNEVSTVSYGNFRNPFGLVFRMLKSGKRAAWSALFREGLQIMTVPIDRLLAPIETKRLQSADINSSQPLVLIVGPPRGGTTMVYQMLARFLDVSAANNFSSLFPHASIAAGRWFARRPTDCNSYFGQTSRFSGVNDAFHIWNRWLGTDRYCTKTDLTDSEIEEMQRYFAAWTAKNGKPFLNKNNRNAHCISYLSQKLPNSFFVIVRRDPAAVVRSLIRARETIQGDKKTGWGLLCQETHASSDPFGYVRDVCEQVQNVETIMAHQTKEIDPHRLIEITYEDFCANPHDCMETLIATVPNLKLRPECENSSARHLRPSTLRPLSDEEERIISEAFPQNHR